MFFNLNTLPQLQDLRWNVGTVLGQKVDVGGLNHYYLQKHVEKLKILYLEFWTIHNIEIHTDGTRTIEFSLNGNTGFFITVTKENKFIDIKKTGFYVSGKKSLPYQIERENYDQFVTENLNKFEQYFKTKNATFPEPYYMDLIKKADDTFENSFIFHYKSGSNWLSFYTEEYNHKKTEELRKLIY